MVEASASVDLVTHISTTYAHRMSKQEVANIKENGLKYEDTMVVENAFIRSEGMPRRVEAGIL
jgi:hypothetical protein